MVRDVSPKEVAAEKSKTKLLFVDCWAPWCNPCLALAPILDDLEKKYADNQDVGFLKVNTQVHVQFAIDNNITGIPCVLIYVDGKLAEIEIETEGASQPMKLDRLVGLRPAEHYEFIISKVLGTE